MINNAMEGSHFSGGQIHLNMSKDCQFGLPVNDSEGLFSLCTVLGSY